MKLNLGCGAHVVNGWISIQVVELEGRSVNAAVVEGNKG